MAKRETSPHPGDLIKVIRELARSGRTAWSDHAFDERRGERSIDIADVLTVFRLGDIEGPILPGRKPGEWRCLVRGPLPWTPREAGVVTVVVRGARLIVVTVEWMDR